MTAQNPNNFVIALAPALVNQGAINYATSNGTKFWKAGIEPLQKELFTLGALKFKVFLRTLADHSMTCRWGSILDVPINAAVPVGPARSILTHY